MSIPPLTVDQLLSTVTLDQQAWLDDHFTTVRELAAAASEFVRAKKEEERVNAKPDISTHILKTKLLSRWPTKFGSMREDPANKWKVMKELDMLNYAVGLLQSYLPQSGARTHLEMPIAPTATEDPATALASMLELKELDLIAASVALASLSEDLKQLVDPPPKLADRLNRAILQSDLRIKFPLVKVVGNVIVKETKEGTEMVNQAEIDEYLTEQFARVGSKIDEQVRGKGL